MGTESMPNNTLPYEQLREQVAGKAVALRVKVRLEPVDGPVGKLFPLTYAVGRNAACEFERRWADGEEEPVHTALINSVAAQAKRTDAIFRDSKLDNTLLPLSDVKRAITLSTPNDSTAMVTYSPTSLLFSKWDSTDYPMIELPDPSHEASVL